jgi:hypothetical protein
LEPCVLFPFSQSTVLDMFDVMEHCVAWTFLVHLRGYQALALAYPLASADKFPQSYASKTQWTNDFCIPNTTSRLSLSSLLFASKNQCGLSFKQYLRFCLLTSLFTTNFHDLEAVHHVRNFYFVQEYRMFILTNFDMIPDSTEILYNFYASLFSSHFVICISAFCCIDVTASVV